MIFRRYLIINYIFAALITSITLASIAILSQSIRYIEFVTANSASFGYFLSFVGLAMPRIFEFVLPVAMIGTALYVVYTKTTNGEVQIFRSTGMSNKQIIRPFFYGGAFFSILFMILSFWLTPLSLGKITQLEGVVKTQLSSILIRPGIFSEVMDDLTLYIHDRNADGTLAGIMIYDDRHPEITTTVFAESGILAYQDDTYKVLVYNGIRQDQDKSILATDKNRHGQSLKSLSFEQYVIDLPEQKSPRVIKTKEPNERPIWQLILVEGKVKRAFLMEAVRRILTPVFMISYMLLLTMFYLIFGSKPRISTAGLSMGLSAAMMAGYIMFLSLMNIAVKQNLALYILLLLQGVVIILFFILYKRQDRDYA